MFGFEDFKNLVEGRLSEADVEAMLLEIAGRGETVEDLVALVQVLRSHQRSVSGYAHAIDTCGTGGSGLTRFNTSTAVAVILAAGGVSVVKHGNRAASGRCGSFDLLEALGCRIDLAPEQVERTVQELGLGFCFARLYHPILASVAPVRQRLGVRTIFNAVGPLLNPAGVKRQVLGVSDPALARTLAQALVLLGSERALVVTGEEGLDEATVTGLTQVIEVRESTIREFSVTPEAMGLERVPFEAIAGGSKEENARDFLALLAGHLQGPKRDLVVMNAGAGFLVADQVASWGEGIARAVEVLDSGAAYDVFDRYRSLTQLL